MNVQTIAKQGFSIPAENLTRQYTRTEREITAAVQDVLQGGVYSLGPRVAAFEQEFAAYCQARYCVGISNGTEALHLALLAIAARHNLVVIEDAAHAHGAEYKGRRAGSLGQMGCFSFYPTKVLGCYGDGGAVTTSDPALYERLRILRYMGQRIRYRNEIVGYQQRLVELQAAVLRVRLPHLDGWIEERRQWAALYDELLTGLPVITPGTAGEVRHVYYLYTIRAPRRDALLAYLAEHDFGAQVVYPLEAPFQEPYLHLGYREGDLPVSGTQVREILCLPMFPELTDEEVRRVASTIRSFYHGEQVPDA